MAQVLIRNLDESVVHALRARAKTNGRSLEAELRLLLERAASNPQAHAPTQSVMAGEATIPYGAAGSFEDTHYRDPNYPGILFPKKKPSYKPFKPIKLRGKGPSLSEQIIAERE